VDDAALYARNWAFIPTGVQAALRQSVVYAAGSGLASTIVELACRTGFTRFILADGDTVELSNLNRQGFTHAQIGQNKAAATADLLRRIRPDVVVEVLPRMLDAVTCLEPLARADLVINSLDFDQPAIFALNRAAQAANKPVLQPVNLGWGGAVLIFNAETPSLEQFLEVDPATVEYGEMLRRFIERVVRELPGGLPAYLAPLFAQFRTDGAWWRESPQLGVAAHLTSALAVRALVALVARAPVRVVPRVVHCDLRALLEPAG
jgi:molybdopterin/thiamine biosynthesis adenylyltransferase